MVFDSDFKDFNGFCLLCVMFMCVCAFGGW